MCVALPLLPERSRANPVFVFASHSVAFLLSLFHPSVLSVFHPLILSHLCLPLSVPYRFSGWTRASLAPFRNYFPAHLASGSSQLH